MAGQDLITVGFDPVLLWRYSLCHRTGCKPGLSPFVMEMNLVGGQSGV